MSMQNPDNPKVEPEQNNVAHDFAKVSEEKQFKTANRFRTKQKKFYVTEEEYKILMEKYSLSGLSSFSDYIIRMGINGFIIVKNYDGIIELTNEIHNIGKDINTICQNVELGKEVTLDDIVHLDNYMKKIWKGINKLIRMQDEARDPRKQNKPLKETEKKGEQVEENNPFENDE